VTNECNQLHNEDKQYAMSNRPEHIDNLLRTWQFVAEEVLVRRTQGDNGRDLLLMRVDMGVLQLEVTGKPDGKRPGGFDTYYDYLVATAFSEGQDFHLDAEKCMEVDREFYQYYHRRICWLALKEYGAATKDAEHTLKLMDFTSANAPDPQWALMHEQYRPFVLFHKVQALALVALEKTDHDSALNIINQGLQEIERLFEEHDVKEQFDEDPFVIKLHEMRNAIEKQYDIGSSLAQQLADAVAAEQYELAAKIRDLMTRRPGEK
jgi:UvrB/uvrC motif